MKKPSSFHTEVKVVQIPNCDICKDKQKKSIPAFADAVIDGRYGWASVCETHFKQFNCKLGLGRGQKYILQVTK